MKSIVAIIFFVTLLFSVSCSKKPETKQTTPCCSPTPTTVEEPNFLPVAASSCCSPEPADGQLHDKLVDLLSRYQVNDYAASVKVYAVK